MNILKALVKIKKLSKPELKHMIQLCEDEIKNYDIVCRNYPAERMARIGLQHQQILLERKKKFIDELNSRQQTEKLL